MEALSVCYIVRNEEMFLEASLQSIEKLGTKILVHDTGSTDRTLDILKNFQTKNSNLRYRSVEWQDDFALARNRLADEAESEWILFMDGDEVLDSEGASQILGTIGTDKADCFSLIQRNYTSDFDLHGVELAPSPPRFLNANKPIYFFDNWMERLYRKSSGIRYEGRIHESILPSCRRLKKKHEKLPVILHHAGRLKPTHSEKLSYYLNLSQKKLVEEPENPAAWIELAITCNEIGQIVQALHLMAKAVQKFENEPEVLRIAAECALRAENFPLAEKWIRQHLQKDAHHFSMKARLSTALLYQGKFDEAETFAKSVLQEDTENFHAHLNLGIIYFEKKEFEKARPHLRFAAQLRPEDQFLQNALKKLPS